MSKEISAGHVVLWEDVPDDALVGWHHLHGRDLLRPPVAVWESAIRREGRGYWVITADDGYQKRSGWAWNAGVAATSSTCTIIALNIPANTAIGDLRALAERCVEGGR